MTWFTGEDVEKAAAASWKAEIEQYGNTGLFSEWVDLDESDKICIRAVARAALSAVNPYECLSDFQNHLSQAGLSVQSHSLSDPQERHSDVCLTYYGVYSVVQAHLMLEMLKRICVSLPPAPEGDK